jgi:phosphate-selective porin OprO/OprP
MSMQKAASAALFLLPVFPATAQTSQVQLERLVRDQAAALEAQQARIDALERRLAALEPVVQETAVTAAEVAKARPVVETRLDRLERLRNLPAGNAALRPASDPLTAPSPSQAANVDDESFDWTKGLPQITSADGKSAMRLRGRMLFDTSSSFGSNFDRRNITGTKARAIRLGVEGKLGDMIGYQVEFDLTDNQAALRGAYLSFTKKWGDNIYELSLGNRLTDRSMEGASSSDSQPFLERNATALATAPRKGSFGLGAMARVYGKTWHAAVQLDGNEASTNGSVSDSTTLTGRVHWNPWRNSEAIVHLGAWGYREDFSSGVASIPLSTRIGGRFNELITVQASSLLDPDHGQAFGLELGGVYKNFWVFGEYGERDVWARDSAGGRHVGVRAGSIGTGVYLTGEKPPYVARGGVWSKPRVLRPITDGGWGAVEIAARYDKVSYSGALGGDGYSTTLGLNWYLLDWVRVTPNWIHWRTENRAGAFAGADEGNTVVGRVAVSF